MAKYFYNSTTVFRFCKVNSLNYQSICSSIRYRINKKKNDLDYIISEVIDIYIKRRNRKIIIKQIETLKNNNYINNKELKNDCRFLNISSKNVNYISKLNYHPSMVLIVLFFFVSNVNLKKEISINRKKFEILLTKIKNEKSLKNSILLYNINYYKDTCKIYELIDKNLLSKKSTKILYKYSLPHSCKEDIESELTITLLTILKNLLPYEQEQIYKYIHLVLNSTIPRICIKYRPKDISLYKKINGSDKELIDYLVV